jgi:hypothetical protein
LTAFSTAVLALRFSPPGEAGRITCVAAASSSADLWRRTLSTESTAPAVAASASSQMTTRMAKIPVAYRVVEFRDIIVDRSCVTADLHMCRLQALGRQTL